MKELHDIIQNLMQKVPADDKFLPCLSDENIVFPFNVASEQLTFLLDRGIITYNKYQEIILQYCARNKYLYLFEMAPRTFGQTWGEEHITEIIPQFLKATKANLADLYPAFDGEFDLWYDGIRVEVKACRANKSGVTGNLAGRAYLHEEAVQKKYKYHYQQLKPSCCDVFIWIGVCRDKLLYWVLSSADLLKTGKLGPQHRNENTGVDNAGVFEGQVFMTEEELACFAVPAEQILAAVKAKGNEVLNKALFPIKVGKKG